MATPNANLSPDQYKRVSDAAAYELGCAVGLVKYAFEDLRDPRLRDHLIGRMTPDHELLINEFRKAGAQIGRS